MKNYRFYLVRNCSGFARTNIKVLQQKPDQVPESPVKFISDLYFIPKLSQAYFEEIDL